MPSRAYTQRFPLPAPRGQVGFQFRPPNSNGLEPAPVEHTGVTENIALLDPLPTLGETSTSHKKKRFAQFQHWNDEVIPRLVRPYLAVLRATCNLAENPVGRSKDCVCLSKARKLDLVVVRFHRLENLSLQVCSCRPAADQLMERALFGCAPMYPSLAVDLRVLEFVNR
ncbi:hypothetical protein F5880DRAFT_1494629, partial [Lentinula raphanica]